MIRRNDRNLPSASPTSPTSPTIRCAIYTRKSSEEGLEQEFNSLDAQRESGEAFIASQKAEGWVCLPEFYDDGGYTGGNMKRPALQRLIADIENGLVDCVVVYKVDRLSRTLLDFARLMDMLEQNRVSFVSVTQQFNTTTSIGRLTLNMLTSFAQFEREMIGERTRDKIAATRRKGKWSGGTPILGFDVRRNEDGSNPRLVVNEDEAVRVRQIFDLYLEKRSLIPVVRELNRRGWRTKSWETKRGRAMGGQEFTKNRLYRLLGNPLYFGKVGYRGELYEGEHEAIVQESVWAEIQVRLRRNGAAGGREARNKYGAILRGLLYCTPCGYAMPHTYTAKGSKRYRYYVCHGAQEKGWDSCPTKSVPAAEIEQFVVDQIRCIGRDPSLIETTLEEAGRQRREQLVDLRKERAGLERDLKRVAGRTAKTLDSAHLADLLDQTRAIEQRVNEIEREVKDLDSLDVTERDVRQALGEFDTLWAAMTIGEQCRILKLLIERIEYDGKEGTVKIQFRSTGIKALVDEHASNETEAAA